MAVTRLFPTKSNTLYSKAPYLNSGIDQMIELTGSRLDVSRILLSFDKNEILNTIDGLANWSAKLKLYAAAESGLPEKYTVKLYMSHSEWKEGTGNYLNYPATTTGSNWIYTDSSTGHKWVDDISGNVIGDSHSTNAGGGNWYATPLATYEVTKHISSDLYVDVSNIIHELIASNSSGLLIKLDGDHENNYNETINIKYFSEDTNTVYRPVLEIRHNDSVYVEADTVIDSLNLAVGIGSPYNKISLSDVVRIKVGLRKLFAPKSYSRVYSPITSLGISDFAYWQLKDVNTGEIVIDGDISTTKISCDGIINYFDFIPKNLYKNKYYSFDIFIKVGSNIKKFSPNYIFSVDD